MFISKLKKNPVFKFCSSVKLAIPLLTLLLIASVVGTLIESRHNAEIASIQIYSAPWFIVLLCMLWINIFSATISRIPFKKHHLGFVITHIGLLSLLIGSIMTKLWGIDGSIQIQEKTQSRYVSLPQLVYEVGQRGTPGYFKSTFTRSLKPLEKGDLSFLNKSSYPLFAVSYKPFVAPPMIASDNFSGEGKLDFKLESQFFNVDQSLHLSEKPELRMGPALIRYKLVKSKTSVAKKQKKNINSNVVKKQLEILDSSSGEVLKKVNLSTLKNKSISVKGIEVKLIKSFEQAVVVNNKLDEGGQEGVNPALEINLIQNGQSHRDILYAKFPDFSLLGKLGLPITARYVHPAIKDTKKTSSHSGEAVEVPEGNVIEFIKSTNEGEVNVYLFKNKQEVLSKTLKVGEQVETPWMGMKITLTSLGEGNSSGDSVKKEVQELEMPFKAPLPGSALKVSTMDGNSTWLHENHPQSVVLNGKEVDVYFGRSSIDLPFSIFLEKFYKKDYPGSTTPMSYESDVKVNGQGETIKIAMNEPLKHGGYTFYQSSYILEPGRPPVTVLSVNKDPGRWIKYIGSLVLCMGIMIYTLMKSRVYKRKGTSNV